MDELADKAAKKAILAGDRTVGKHLVDTPLEHKLLDKWLDGKGTPYRLSNAELNAVKNDPTVKKTGERICNGDTKGLTPVELSDQSHGWRADLSLDKSRQLDGSIGKARVYFDRQGHAVGLRDSYDFSNDNPAADATNVAGAMAGAKNYLVTGGVTGQPSSVRVPEGPKGVASAASLEGRGANFAIDGAGKLANAGLDAQGKLANWGYDQEGKALDRAMDRLGVPGGDQARTAFDKTGNGVEWLTDKQGDGIKWAADKAGDGVKWGYKQAGAGAQELWDKVKPW